MSKSRVWTEKDERYLVSHYGTMPDEQLARRLRRTVLALNEHALRLGHGRRSSFLNVNATAHIFGVWSSTVVGWIKKGYMSGKKSDVVRSGRYSIWRIEYDEVIRFIREHPDIYDFRKIDPVEYRYWRNLANPLVEDGRAPKLVRKWTPQEDAYLLNHHGKLTNQQIGERLRRTKEAVHYRKEVLRTEGYLLPYCYPWRGRWKSGKRITAADNEKWTPEQDQVLRDNWGRLRREDEKGWGRYVTAKELARHVGHTQLACLSRAYRLEITRGRGHRSDLDIIQEEGAA